MLNSEAQRLANFLAKLALRIQAPDGNLVIERLTQELERTESEWSTLFRACGYITSSGFNEVNSRCDNGLIGKMVVKTLGEDLNVQAVLSLLDSNDCDIVDSIQGMRHLKDMTIDARRQGQFIFGKTTTSEGITFLVCDCASQDHGREAALFGVDDVLAKGTVLLVRSKAKLTARRRNRKAVDQNNS